MSFFIILVTIVLSIFSTGVMSYVALATPIGPWIAPTLVLIATPLIRIFIRGNSSTMIALATAGGSVGGILATACAFSFPTLYFLDSTLFASWMAQPWYFCLIMTMLCFAAGGLAFVIASALEEKCIVEEKMAFPIGQLVYEMIAVQNQISKAIELAVGFCSALIISFLQGGFLGFKGIIPRVMTILKPMSFGAISIPLIQLRFDMLPMLVAIGFITGHVIALPLAVGSLAKIFVADPINKVFFSYITEMDFLLAFCSGIVVIGALQSFLDFPQFIRNAKKMIKNSSSANYYAVINRFMGVLTITEIVGVLMISILFLSYFKFSLLSQLYLIIGTIICTYQIVVIAGKIGMAQLGRFATFVMAPAMLFFGIDFTQLTFMATFVEICGGITTDLLFNRKMGYMAHIDHARLRRYQLLGFVVSSLSVGIIFWLLIHHFGLGSEHLFAQRAQARALLINATSFDLKVLALGALFGFLLKKMKLNPMLVLGGLLMPIAYSLGLIIGGFIALVVPNRQQWEPFWSGVFAANSISELLKTIW